MKNYESYFQDPPVMRIIKCQGTCPFYGHPVSEQNSLNFPSSTNGIAN